MLGRKAKTERVITNFHGLRFTEKEAKRYISKIEQINKRIDKVYKKLIKGGVSEKLARSMAGDPIPVSIHQIANKEGSWQSLLKSLSRATMRRVSEDTERVITNMMQVFADRYGLTKHQLEALEDALRSMTVVEFAKWYENNEDLVDDIFDTSPVSGDQIVSQDELDRLYERIKEALELVDLELVE